MQVQIPVSASADPSRVPHCLSNSPSHSHQVQVQVQVLFFPSLYYNTKKCFKPICFSKMQCNAMQYQVAWHASSAKSQGIDSEDKITTWIFILLPNVSHHDHDHQASFCFPLILPSFVRVCMPITHLPRRRRSCTDT